MGKPIGSVDEFMEYAGPEYRDAVQSTLDMMYQQHEKGAKLTELNVKVALVDKTHDAGKFYDDMQLDTKALLADVLRLRGQA